ncbi:hypothetical protein IX53_00610 [Kosmotoga pacifica]|uniref:Uncharacterized protein n=3 Tax=Kosmotoga pacifica TaxID=1330330 RepID=A0A0G2ZCT5_9BACT|nr:hypothetical protein IX53_00610 [Kosmotoga pacifica]
MEIKESTGRTRVILERILNLILKIDEAQDRQIDEIAKKAILIAHINRISNQILAPYDVSVERYKPRENRQLVLNLPIELGIQTFRRRDVS